MANWIVSVECNSVHALSSDGKKSAEVPVLAELAVAAPDSDSAQKAALVICDAAGVHDINPGKVLSIKLVGG